MHELAIVQSLVDELQRRITPQDQVKEIRLERGSDFSEDSLRELFAALTKGTSLENAPLMVEIVPRHVKCTCGYDQVVTPEDLVGHMFVCPACGQVIEVPHADDLKLIDITVSQTVRGRPING